MDKIKHIFFAILMFMLLFYPAVFVFAEDPKPVRIVQQPSNQYTRYSGTVTFSVKAKASGKLSYQWYVKKLKKTGKYTKWMKMNGKNSRSLVINRCTYGMDGYMYKCNVKCGGYTKTSKAAKLTITDIDRVYSFEVNPEDYSGLYEMKAVDNYCYVYCHEKKYANYVKQAINIINSKVGQTFIYTDTGCIADIVIILFDEYDVEPNIWLRNDEIVQINSAGGGWAGVTFYDDRTNASYLVGLNKGYFPKCTKASIRGVIIHELGHCIGLQHSVDDGDIMTPNIIGTDTMSKNDIARFRKQRKIMHRIGFEKLQPNTGMRRICCKYQKRDNKKKRKK